MELTLKQERFCQEVIKQDTYSKAYRIAYDCSRMSIEAVNVEASNLMKNPKISIRVKELKEKVSEKKLYSLEKSIKSDLRLIERYEKALLVLENSEAKESDIKVAERTIKFIGVVGYNSAQDRLSKQHGYFEKDNRQKKIADRVIIDKSDYNKG